MTDLSTLCIAGAAIIWALCWAAVRLNQIKR